MLDCTRLQSSRALQDTDKEIVDSKAFVDVACKTYSGYYNTLRKGMYQLAEKAGDVQEMGRLKGSGVGAAERSDGKGKIISHTALSSSRQAFAFQRNQGGRHF